MCTALLRAPPCLCVHIDRLTQNQDNRILKCMCTMQVDDEVLVPVFTGSKLRIEHVEYTVLSVMSHFGHDNEGHYRAAWKVASALTGLVQPTSWLTTDDWSPPVPCWQLDTSFRRHINMAWLVRTDCVHLIKYQQQFMPETSADPATAIMALMTRNSNTR